MSIGLGGGVAGVIELRTLVGFSSIMGKLNFLRNSFLRSNDSSKLPKLNLNIYQTFRISYNSDINLNKQ